jgi:hypothetical protein
VRARVEGLGPNNRNPDLNPNLLPYTLQYPCALLYPLSVSRDRRERAIRVTLRIFCRPQASIARRAGAGLERGARTAVETKAYRRLRRARKPSTRRATAPRHRDCQKESQKAFKQFYTFEPTNFCVRKRVETYRAVAPGHAIKERSGLAHRRAARRAHGPLRGGGEAGHARRTYSVVVTVKHPAHL